MKKLRGLSELKAATRSAFADLKESKNSKTMRAYFTTKKLLDKVEKGVFWNDTKNERVRICLISDNRAIVQNRAGKHYRVYLSKLSEIKE